MKEKKIHQPFVRLTRSAGAILVGGALAVALGISATARQGSELSDEIRVDRTPPMREGDGATGGYAGIVEQVAPSVVSVFSTRNVESARVQGNLPFGEDSPFRRFFGEEEWERFFGQPRQGRPQPKQRGQGSGVILTSDGYILTNNHVVEKADEILVALDGRKKKFEAEIVGTDPQTDLAVLKIEASNLPAATLGDSSLLLPGDVVLAIGNPFGLDQTVTSGIVSAVGRDDLNITGYDNFIQTDASINPGNSGGALIDNRGRVIGINTAIFSRSGGNVGIGFAIPVNMAVDIADELISDGVIERGYVGVMLGELTPDLANALGLEEMRGVLVNDVLEDTPAERAGLQAGDVITAYDGTPVEEISKLRLRVGNTDPGETVALTLVRDGKTREVNLTIGKLEAGQVASVRGRNGGSQPAPASFLDGVTVTELTRMLRERYRVEQGVRGLLVTEVAPESAAAEAGLRPGEVITEVAGEPVETLAEARKLSRNAKSGTLLLRVAGRQGSRFLAVDITE